jgi:hypothetical protein
MITKAGPLHGLLAEFGDEHSLLEAVRKIRAAGYVHLDAYTPYPVEGLAEELGFHTTRVPLAVLTGGILGAASGYFLQYWLNVLDYPLNVGGRPLNSIPSWIIISFELTILTGALFAVLGMLALNGLPRPNHPVFNVPEFALASTNRFFLAAEAKDPRFDPNETRRLIEGLGPKGVWDIVA